MLRLLISTAVFGVSAVDPVGIAIVLILLAQKNPLRRCIYFLSGSFLSLIGMGLLFTQGFGTFLLRFETTRPWILTNIENAAGVLLVGMSVLILWRIKTGKLEIEPSKTIKERLKFGKWQLCLVGALLVAVQSIIDVVFVLAMIRIGQLHLHFVQITAAVLTYAVSALVLQLVVVAIYLYTPNEQRQKTLQKVHSFVENHAYKILAVVSLLLGLTLVYLGR